jgi:L-threonylcarbamoyladenylate synthase
MKKITFDSPLAGEILSKGYVIALPTETVYGLGVKWDDESAYQHLVQAKRRNPDKAIAVMAGRNFNLSEYFVISDRAKKVMDHFLPGPLTCLVKARENAPYQSHLGTYVAGIRIPKKKDLLEFLESLGYPLQVTSANISGQPATKDFHEVERVFQDEPLVQGIVEGECDSGTPTTVVSLVDDKPVIIRQGDITKEEIDRVYFE